ncbi:LacI family DNA-binding transcriptional regulator [Microlunatus ginsengisoli]|uniref:LacI family DNA-binding transcriptional regulator n=1 Tax=Microlunatus ginsengisoli TaxID=363863 RepID=A0ABP7ACB5_9ACTN
MAKTAGQREHTVADVAREAGVSKAQAARALGEYGAVSDAVRSRVVAAAERLGYRPNQLARSMNTGRSLSVGVVVGDIENPYFALATRGISDAVEEHGFTVVLSNTSERLAAERTAVEMLMDKRVDGLIVAPSTTEAGHLDSVLQAGRPLVLLDRGVPGLPVDLAGSDVSAAAVEAAEELIALGHRRIGYITTSRNDDNRASPQEPLSSPVASRVAALAQAFELNGLRWDESLLRDGLRGEASIASAVDDLVRDKATALIASDSLIGQVVIAALQQKGLRIPDDVSVLMYDDQPWARLLNPPITVIAQPTYDIGYTAGSRLAALIQRRSGLPPLSPFPGRLIRRASFGPVRSAHTGAPDAVEPLEPPMQLATDAGNSTCTRD